MFLRLSARSLMTKKKQPSRLVRSETTTDRDFIATTASRKRLRRTRIPAPRLATAPTATPTPTQFDSQYDANFDPGGDDFAGGDYPCDYEATDLPAGLKIKTTPKKRYANSVGNRLGLRSSEPDGLLGRSACDLARQVSRAVPCPESGT